jgi:transposase-like protein
MALIPVRCPYCQSTQVIKCGKTDTGKQRYRCHNPACSHQSFLLDSAYKGRSPQIKQQVIELSLNGSGVRDTARVLGISPTTVLNELKKRGDTLFCEPLSHSRPVPEPRRGPPPTPR